MNDDIRRFGDDLGRRAIARDWTGVHTLLAPWLRQSLSVDDVRAFFEDDVRDTLVQSDAGEGYWPEHPTPYLGGNAETKATQLRAPSWDGTPRDVPAELTDDAMRYWMRVRLDCSDDQADELGLDYLTEVWAAVVETDEGLRVGYWTHSPD